MSICSHLGHVVVDDPPDIGFIKAHPKRNSRHDDAQLPAHEVVLDATAL